jgi:hypothetical protein
MVVLDPEIEGATGFEKYCHYQRICADFYSVLFPVCAVAPSCLNRQSYSSNSNNDMKFLVYCC